MNKWMKDHWRPAMGWMYMIVCVFDFIIFPTAWAWHLADVGQAVVQWKPLTLEMGGFFHAAMGAVLGIYAWRRTDEKLKAAQILEDRAEKENV